MRQIVELGGVQDVERRTLNSLVESVTLAARGGSVRVHKGLAAVSAALRGRAEFYGGSED